MEIRSSDPARSTDRRRWSAEMAALVFGLITLLSLALLAVDRGSSLPEWPSTGSAVPGTCNVTADGRKNDVVRDYRFRSRDRLLGGLLSPDFDEATCWSRYEAGLYRNPSPFPVSAYLVEKLREYELRHRKCGPGGEHYAAALEAIKSGRNADSPECKYVAWFPENGIGNRMLSVTSAFLYALLNNRVLLVRSPIHADEDLFCEPFPNSTWSLSPDFPFFDSYWRLNEHLPESHLNMLKDNKVRYGDTATPASSLPPFVYFHLINRGSRLSEHTFCDEDHLLFDKFQWVLIKSDCFFATALFLMPMYSDELHRLFPEKQAVFHHLGRYLLHPSNKVWGMVTRYYDGYLAHSDEKIGIQVRVFTRYYNVSFEVMFAGIKKCIGQNELLPRTTAAEYHNSTSKTKSVLVVSLKSDYYDRLKAMYYENATVTGELVTLHQPTHEEKQRTESTMHNHRAAAEIYLLSLCDKLVTTSWSTFGYVSHSLAGLRPWIMVKAECVRSGSVDPCMLSLPLVKCEKTDIPNLGEHVPYVRHCEDVGYGIKLFDT